ncbi:MAG: TonB-dependent receptor, partial [Brevundimonas sp.]
MSLSTTALTGLAALLIQAADVPQDLAAAQDPGQEETWTDEDGVTSVAGLVITAPRQRGEVQTDIAPELELDAADIQAYGASDIAQLLEFLEPVTTSSRGGSPVFLVNGRRISGFREIRGLPSEAIERVQVLPEEVALQFGYRADQRVVNFILKDPFRSTTAEIELRGPTAGGRPGHEVEADILRIDGDNRWSFDIEHERDAALFETERDIVREPGSTPYDLIGNISAPTFGDEIDPAFSGLVGETALVAPVPLGGTSLADFADAYGPLRTGNLSDWRTLQPETEQNSISATLKRGLPGDVQATLSASLEDETSERFNGLPGLALTVPSGVGGSPFSQDVTLYRFLDAPEALSTRTDTLQAELGVLLDGFIGDDWRWSVNGEYTRTERDTVTGRGFDVASYEDRLEAGDPTATPFGPLTGADFTRRPDDLANSVTSRYSAEAVFNGPLTELPAGDLRSTFTLGADRQTLESWSLRADEETARELSRDRLNAQTSFDIPLFEMDEENPSLPGDLSLNLNVGYEDVSDFGGLNTLGANLNWSPVERLSFLTGYTRQDQAPTIAQLNDPVIATPNTAVFDFSTGETVLVTRTTGGNPDLEAATRSVWNAGVNWQPLEDEQLRITSTWTRTSIENEVNGFPAVTAALEAALPDRFTRDDDGTLVAVDARPVSFAEVERQDLRTGFTFSRTFGQADAPAPQRGRGPRGEGGGRPDGPGADGPPPGGGGMRGGGRGGRGPGGMQPGQGRFNISLFHTWRIQDEILIAPG